MAGWLDKFKRLFVKEPFEGLESAQFVTNSQSLPEQVLEMTGRAPVRLPSSLLPGFLVVGELQSVGNLGFVSSELSIGSKTQNLPSFEGLKLRFYPDGSSRSGQGDPWSKAEGSLKYLHQEVLKYCLADENTDHQAGTLAVRMLARLKGRDDLDQLEREFLRFLESKPIFPCYYDDPPGTPKREGPRLLSLNDLRKARVLYIMPQGTEPYLSTIEPYEEGKYFFAASDFLMSIAKSYSLPLEFGTEGLELQWSPYLDRTPKPPDPNEELLKSFREKAHRVDFGEGKERDGCFVFSGSSPEPGFAPLEIDLSCDRICGTDLEGMERTIPFRDLSEVSLLVDEWDGDLKSHIYRYLVMASGELQLVYYQHSKEYFESHPSNAELYRKQERGEKVLTILESLGPGCDAEKLASELRAVLTT